MLQRVYGTAWESKQQLEVGRALGEARGPACLPAGQPVLGRFCCRLGVPASFGSAGLPVECVPAPLWSGGGLRCAGVL